MRGGKKGDLVGRRKGRQTSSLNSGGDPHQPVSGKRGRLLIAIDAWGKDADGPYRGSRHFLNLSIKMPAHVIRPKGEASL